MMLTKTLMMRWKNKAKNEITNMLHLPGWKLIRAMFEIKTWTLTNFHISNVTRYTAIQFALKKYLKLIITPFIGV